MIDKLNAALSFHREALQLRAERQEILAANIAHTDTPYYKARDLDFNQSLSEAVARGRSNSVSMAVTSNRHITATPVVSAVERELMYRVPTQSSIDGNTVEMDVERVNFADNALHYEANLTMISGQIKSMLSAIQQQ